MYKEVSNELFEFIENCPSAFHTVNTIKEKLDSAGFSQLSESKKWKLEKGKKYYVTRNSSSIIAFKVGQKLNDYSFNITASHSDSPTFKIKEDYNIEVNNYIKLNTEKYGGMIYSSWFDRPLSAAGRLIVRDGTDHTTKLVNIDKDLVLIPNVAIHLNREANSGIKYNEQTDLIPLYGIKNSNDRDILDIAAEYAKVDKNSIISSDLFLYNRMRASVWGSRDEFISAPKLDDLQCAFSTLKGFLSGSNERSVNVYCCFDNEEVGSGTKQGAASTFLEDTLKRINYCLNKTTEDYICALASSFLISADNAHAVHPNHPELSDPTNKVYINGGIVIKHNANQKYTTDAVSSAVLKEFFKNIQIPFQNYCNPSNIAGGSTLGHIASSKVSINMADIGLAQLAMHSSYETAGIKDTYYMICATEEFYNSHIEKVDNDILRITK